MNTEKDILFFFESIEKFDFDHNKHREWIIKIIKSEKSVPGVLSFILTNDKTLNEINQNYMHYDYYTDIITFDYTNDYDGSISGDVFISVDRVRENAIIFETLFMSEFRRVIAHGVLHLLGYNDFFEIEKDIMSEKENHYINLFI